MQAVDFKSFPITRYQGSKRKMLPWIYDTVKDLDFESVLDGFGGSGTVSYLFKKMGKHVTYNDNLKFNHIIGTALIQNQRNKLQPGDIRDLFTWIRENPGENFIENTFGGIYFYRRENEWLDGLSNGILNMNHYVGQTLEYKKAIAYYALFQACIIKRPYNLFHRRNLYMRRKKIERSFGNKITWEVPFEDYFLRFIEEANASIFNSGTRCVATNESVFDVQNVDYDLVYLDPPYLSKDSSNESSNYLRLYHFLEGIANYQEWPNFIDFQTQNLRFSNEEKPSDFNRQNAIEQYHRLFSKFRNSKLVLSYKDNGIPTTRQLMDIMGQYKTDVRSISRPYHYALNKKNSSVKEVLIIGL